MLLSARWEFASRDTRKVITRGVITSFTRSVSTKCILRILTPPAPEGAWSQRGASNFKRFVFWEFWPPGGSLVTKKGSECQKRFLFLFVSQPPRESLATGRIMFEACWGAYGSMWAVTLWKWTVYQLYSYWNQCWTNFGPGTNQNNIKLSITDKNSKI